MCETGAERRKDETMKNLKAVKAVNTEIELTTIIMNAIIKASDDGLTAEQIKAVLDHFSEQLDADIS